MMMATRLVRNRSVLHRAILISPNAIHIPMTHNGGTKDAAIATHANHTAIFLYPKAKNAITHDALAIPRSTSVGLVLAAISLVTSVSGTIHVSTIHIPTHISILTTNNFRALKNSLLFHVDIEKATHCIGVSIGAISIAHITTGVAFTNNHNVAMTTDNIIWLRYSSHVSISSIIFSAISDFCTHSKSRIHRRFRIGSTLFIYLKLIMN